MPGFAGELEDVITGPGFLFTAGARRPEVVMSGVGLPVGASSVSSERLTSSSSPHLLRRAVSRAPGPDLTHTADPSQGTRGPAHQSLPGRG